jgi:hypothetical protein
MKIIDSRSIPRKGKQAIGDNVSYRELPTVAALLDSGSQKLLHGLYGRRESDDVLVTVSSQRVHQGTPLVAFGNLPSPHFYEAVGTGGNASN